MKKLFTFTVPEEKEVDEQTEAVNEAGEKTITIKKVKKSVDKNFYILKPTRTLTDQASLYYGVKLSEGINAGLMTLPALERQNNMFSGAEEDKYKVIFDRLLKLKKEQEELLPQLDKPEIKSVYELNKETTVSLQNQLQKFDNYKNNLLESTAELRARNQTVTWWILNLSFNEDGTNLFGKGNLESKYEQFDKISESDNEYLKLVLKKFVNYISFWCLYGSEKEEEFKALDDVLSLADNTAKDKAAEDKK